MLDPFQSGFDRLLGEKWLLAADAENRGRQQGWAANPPATARPAPVPGVIQQVFPEFHGVAWYWLSFRPRRAPHPGERVRLHFGAVDYLAEIYLNGRLVGEHEGGETPFELNVTDALRAGGDNLLAVRVLNPTDAPIEGVGLKEIPHSFKTNAYECGAGFNTGGILLPVALRYVPPMRVADLHVIADAGTGGIRVTATLHNDTGRAAEGRLHVRAEHATDGSTEAVATADCRVEGAETTCRLALPVAEPREWSPDDPVLYRVTATLEVQDADGARWEHTRSTRCGFRDFRVVDGWFHLNGKRIFVKSAHTVNHFPVGLVVPPDVELMRRDLVYAKAGGMNMVRFAGHVAWPEQLDLCDELGLLVYEECQASCAWEDSPRMAERFDRALREMILRDRHHPSIVIWGLMNEQKDGPVFRHGVGALSLVRELDPTRLVLLNGGRYDSVQSIGSVCNPGSDRWEPLWGVEHPEAPAVTPPWDRNHHGFFPEAGDRHVYAHVPLCRATRDLVRELGRVDKPVFLSEFGIGSQLDLAGETGHYAQRGVSPENPDYALIRSMTAALEADWRRFGMEAVYPFPADFFRESARRHVGQRRLVFDLVRSNPRICGYSLTGLLDHVMTGEGLWGFWRDLKPGILDALRDGFAPLRWCLFVEPGHAYAGRPLAIEAVLANEGALPPGRYPAHLKIVGPAGLAWERRVEVAIPAEAPLAVPVLKETVVLNGPAGDYTLAVDLPDGAAKGDRLPFRLSREDEQPRLSGRLSVWGLDTPPEAWMYPVETFTRMEGPETAVSAWLAARGLECRPFEADAPCGGAETILVGFPHPAASDGDWAACLRRVERGATAVFLVPQAWRQGENTTARLPLEPRGECLPFYDWLYHKECIGKAHPVFDGLPAGGLLPWEVYDQVIPHNVFVGLPDAEEIVAAAFATGYPRPGGYLGGVLLGSYRYGAGRLILNTLRILEHVGRHPAADRLLLNMVRYSTATPTTGWPIDGHPGRGDMKGDRD